MDAGLPPAHDHGAADVATEARDLIAARDWEPAMDACRRLAVQGDMVESLSLLGVVAVHLNEILHAIEFFSQAVEMPGCSHDVAEVLAILYTRAGRLTDALYFGKLATAQGPDQRILPLLGPYFPRFGDVFHKIEEKPLVARGREALDAGMSEEAEQRFRQHLTLEPNDIEAFEGLGRALLDQGKARAAVDILRSVRAMDPASARFASLLGETLTAAGEREQAATCHRLAIRLDGADVACHAARVRDLGLGGKAAEVAEAAAALIESLPPPAAVRPQVSAHGGPLRLGYLCGQSGSEDAWVVAGILREHDRAKYRVTAYGRGALSSSRNTPFRSACDEWRDISEIDPVSLAAIIRGDGIDVLVDANGLWAPGNFAVFGQRPAPVQVAWLHSQGIALPGISHVLDVAGGDGGPTWALPHGLWAFPPPASRPLRPPSGEGVSLGADVKLAELSPDLVMHWARILHAAPESRLVLYDRDFHQPDNSRYLIDLFGDFAVAHRIDVLSGISRAEFFAQVDVALAPFSAASPHAIAEALTAGAPVVALDAGAWTTRVTAAMVRQSGLPANCVAASPDAYVSSVVRLCRSPDSLANLRGKLASLEGTPLHSPQGLARDLEAAYQGMCAAAAAASSD